MTDDVECSVDRFDMQGSVDWDAEPTCQYHEGAIVGAIRGTFGESPNWRHLDPGFGTRVVRSIGELTIRHGSKIPWSRRIGVRLYSEGR